ncbi:MAG: hypothetical protein JW709_05845 [Sedimentisphaerales bacterium]|nr:hypothetical protein [Sedimentisphaerales bacterium]
MINNNQNDKQFASLLSTIESGKTSPDERFLVQLRELSAHEFEARSAKSEAISFWRKIMKSKIIKFAATAVIIVAVIIGINYFHGSGSSVVLAEVLQPILHARTVTMDILVGSEGRQSVIHDEVMGSRIRRTVSNLPDVDIIIDLKEMKVLSLVHAEKTAAYVKLEGLGDMQNYLEWLQKIVVKMKDIKAYQIHDQSLQQIDGYEYHVFVAENNKETITIWVDPETTLPVRIAQKTPNMQLVCNNLQFDVDLDESRFSLEIPEDYKVQEAGKVDFKNVVESDFIETLRIWAEFIEDGHFPDSINLENVVKLGPKIDQGFKRANLSEEQETETAMRWAQGLVFIRFFKGQGQWHYAGKGVEFGDGATPIFWYQPKDSETWRVIYGDLSVTDVAPEDLPE